MTDQTPSSIKYQFATSNAAWYFLRKLEILGIIAGYPTLKPNRGYYTVSVPAGDTDVADEIYGSGDSDDSGAQKKCSHVPDWPTIRHSKSSSNTADIDCFGCGVKGSIRLNSVDVEW